MKINFRAYVSKKLYKICEKIYPLGAMYKLYVIIGLHVGSVICSGGDKYCEIRNTFAMQINAYDRKL